MVVHVLTKIQNSSLKKKKADFFNSCSVSVWSHDLNNDEECSTLFMNEYNEAEDESHKFVSNILNNECVLTKSATITDDTLMFLLTCYSNEENSNNSNNNEKCTHEEPPAAVADDATAALPSGQNTNSVDLRHQASQIFHDHR